VSDALLIESLWAASEVAAGDDEDDVTNGDSLLEELDPSSVSEGGQLGL
jgi:hypothetical protein